MAFGIKSWDLSSYTNGTWTDLVVGSSGNETVKDIILSNTTIGAISVSIRIVTSGGVSQSVILPPTNLAAGTSYVLDVGTINLTSSQKLQVSCASAGIEFHASGVTHA